MTCKAFEGRIIATVDWKAAHAEHGGYSKHDAGHPSGEMVTLTCNCGAKHTTGKADA